MYPRSERDTGRVQRRAAGSVPEPCLIPERPPRARRRHLAAAFATIIGFLLLTLSGSVSAQGGRPARPQSVEITEARYNSVTLTWADPEDETITGYQISRRASDTELHFTFIEFNTGSADPTYTDRTVDSETLYEYRIAAINPADISPLSATVSTTTPEKPFELTLSTDSLTIHLEDTTTAGYTVQLLREPKDEDVTVTITGHEGSSATLDSTELTFTEDNWDTPQTVTITIATGADDVVVALTHTAKGGGFEDVSPVLNLTARNFGILLGSLTTSPRDIIGFQPDQRIYAVGLDSGVARATILAEPLRSESTVTFDGVDADLMAPGYQVDLAPGFDTIIITVADEAANYSRTYTVTLGRGTTDTYGWKAVDDLDGLRAAANTKPAAVWGNGTTLWVSDRDQPLVYAYNRDGTRDTSKEIALSAANGHPTGIWSNGETMWVADRADKRLYAYRLSDGMRVISSDIFLAAANGSPTGIWSDAATVWVGGLNDTRLYAYRLVDGARRSNRDFDTQRAHRGFWSDGVDWWISEAATGAVLPLDRETGVAKPIRRFLTPGRVNGNRTVGGLWSDGETMWVADEPDQKVYSYNMPLSENAELSTLAVNGTEVSGFNSKTIGYAVDMGEVQQVTVSAATRQANARITSITPADADPDQDGHQVSLHRFETRVVVVVVDQAELQLKRYTLTIRSRALVLSEESLTLAEGSTAAVSYTAWLPDQPAGTVRVRITGHTDADLTLDNYSLTFTTANWNVPQTVEVSVGEDEDSRDDATALTHTMTGDGYIPTRLPVRVVDDDRSRALGSLTVRPRDIIGFTTDRTDYAVGMASTVTEATIFAPPLVGSSTVTFNTADTDEITNGHQVDLAPGTNTVTITVADVNARHSRVYTVTIGRGVTDAFGWKAVDDLDGLRAEALLSPTGVWGNGTTLWVTDIDGSQVYAYNRDGTRDTSKEIALIAENDHPTGIWSDGETMWVADGRDAKLYAYRLSDGMRVDSRDINASAGRGALNSVWSDGETVWVGSVVDSHLFAYRLADGVRASSRDLLLGTSSLGHWSDGVTWWISDGVNPRVFAIDRDSGNEDADRGFPTLSDAGNASPNGIWSDGVTVWVVDDGDQKVYSYNMPVSSNADLRTLAVDGTEVSGFDFDTTSYIFDVVGVGRQVTISAEARQAKARITSITPADADAGQDGHQVNLDRAENPVVVTVTAQDGGTKSYTVTVRTPTVLLSEESLSVAEAATEPVSYTVRLVARPTATVTVTVSGHTGTDLTPNKTTLSFTADNFNVPQTVTLTAAEDDDAADDTVTLRHVASGGGYDGVSADLAVTIDDRFAVAIGLSEESVTVVEGATDDLMYTVQLLSRPTASVTVTVSGHTGTDLTPNRTTLSFTADDWNVPQTVTLAAAQDEDAADETVTLSHMAGGGNYEGVSADLAIMIDDDETASLVLSDSSLSVSEGASQTTYSVGLSHVPTTAVSVAVSVEGGEGLSILGSTNLGFNSANWNVPKILGFVADQDDDTANAVLTLRHTASGGEYDGLVEDIVVAIADDDDVDVLLASLTVAPRNIIHFDPGRTEYAVGMASTVTQATIVATPRQSASTVTFTGTDADGNTAGHQVDLTPGVNTVTFTVTSEDANSSRDYTLTIGRGVTDVFRWKAVDDLDSLWAFRNDNPVGVWGNSTTLWVSDLHDLRLYAYNRDGTRDASSEIAIRFENDRPTGLWSDGQTMWVADARDREVYAYRLSDGERVGSRDITLDSDNEDPTAIWSDGETMWVVDSDDGKAYAYRLSDGTRSSPEDLDVGTPTNGLWSDGLTWWVAGPGGVLAWDRATSTRDSSKDLVTVAAGNLAPRGVWSDGVTMWVVDGTNDKVYSYNLPVSGNADLRTLAVDGTEVSGFGADTTSYLVDVGGVERVTISAAASHHRAQISIAPTDADDVAPGHQVDIDGTETPAVVTVTAQDGTIKRYAVTLRDPSPQLSEDSLDLLEGDTVGASYTVRLPFQPSSSVTVTITGHAGTDLSLNTTDLTFTTANWNIAQTVTVTAAADPDAADDAVTLTHTASGGGYESATAVLPVTVHDTQLLLRSLIVSPRDIIGFVPQRRFHAVGMASTVTQATITAAPMVDTSTVTFNGTDADDQTAGHQVDLAPGPNVVTVTVTAQDGTSSSPYFITIGRGVTDAFGWNAVGDLDGLNAALNGAPFGLWGNDTTLWVSDTVEDHVYAYDKDGSRDASKEIPLHADNDNPAGIWSDSETIWVADRSDNRLYAYRLSDGERVGSRDITLDADNDRPFGIWSDGETMWVADLTDAKLYGYRLSDGMRDASKDFDPHGNPLGLWSDGATWWVVDEGTGDVIATDHDTGAEDSDKRFTTLREVGNSGPGGIWSDGETMWVVESLTSAKVYSYNMPRSSNADLRTLAVDGTEVSGFAFDTTSYTVDVGTARQVTITAVTRQLTATITSMTPADADADADDHQVDVNKAETSVVVTVSAQDGTTKSYTVTLRAPAVVLSEESLTVTEGAADAVSYGVRLSRAPSSPVTVTIAGHDGTDLRLDETTLTFTIANWNIPQAVRMTAVDDTDTMNDVATLTHTAIGGGFDGRSTDLAVRIEDDERLRLSALTVSPRNIIGFAPDRRDYAVGVSSTVDQATIAATPRESTSTVTFDSPDADDQVDGHQVNLVLGINTVTVTVTNDQGTSSAEYTVMIGRGVTDAFAWKAADDMDGLRAVGNDNPFAVWGNGTTLWVSDTGDARIYAYNSDGTRDASREIALDADNGDSAGIWSDGERMWVADNADGKLYAYSVSDGRRASSRDITLRTQNDNPTGIWSDGETMWVADGEDGKLYAYLLSDGTPHSPRDFGAGMAPQGHWSDGLTWWVAGPGGVLAWDRATSTRDSSKDLATVAAGNLAPRGVWSDGVTMWVVDGTNHKVYSYNLPLSGNADLSTLAVDGTEVSGFAFDTTSYTAGVDATVRQVTVSAKARQSHAAVTGVTPADADPVMEGHQVDINQTETPVTVTVTAQDGTTKSYTVTVRLFALVLSGTSLMVTEEVTGGATYWVRLSHPPLSSVSVMISGHAGTDLSPNKTRLTFTAENWSTPQTVTVTAGEDEDSVDDAVTLTHTSSGGSYLPADLQVSVIDNDRRVVLRSLTVSPRDIIGFTPDRRDYAVGVASTVTQATIVAPAHSDFSTVTFDGADGDDLVAGHQVDLVAGVNTVTITVTSQDGNYSRDYTLTIGRGVTDAFGWKAVDDLDGLKDAGHRNPYGVWSDGTTLWVGDLHDFLIRAYNKDGTRDTSKDIALHSSNDGPTGMWSDGETMWVADRRDNAIYAYRLSDGERVATRDIYVAAGIQTPNGIWSDGETMWVSSLTGTALAAYRLSNGMQTSLRDFDHTGYFVSDHWSDGATWWVSDLLTRRIIAIDRDSGMADIDNSFDTFGDDTTPWGFWSDGETVWVVHSDDAKVYSYNMPRSSNADLRTLAVDGTEVSGFAFDTTSYTVDVDATVRQVTVSAEPRQLKATITSITPADADPVMEGHQVDINQAETPVTVTVTAQDATTKSYTVTVRGPSPVLGETSLSVDEGDTAGGSYTVALATQPSAEVTVTVSGHAGSDVTVEGLSASDTLTFTTANWATAQTVTVKAAADDDGADDSVTLTHTAAGGDYDTVTADLAVTVVDDDRGLVFSPDPLSVGEGDTTGGSYTVALATQPSAEVTVTVSGHAGSDVTVEGLSASDTLTFTTANWATAQTVTVKAAADDDGADDSVTLTHTAAGGDYDTVTADLAVTVVDDDRGLVFSPDPLSVGEGDTTGGSYTVALATQPSAEVTVTVSGHAGSDVTVEGLSASDTLTFTTANWATAQTVTVKAAADDDGADDSVTLTHTAAGGDYDTVTADLAVTVVDDDRGLVFSPDPLSVGEGDTTGGSYTVALATQPSAEVTVTVSGHAGSDVTVEGLSASDTLTFTTANWATAQTVTVKAAADDDGADDSVTLTHTAAGGDYDTVTADLAVTVVDDDRGLVFSPDPLSVGEGDTTGGSYTVALATQPSAEVTVTVSGHAGSDVTVEGLSASDTLTFTTANWATAQTVTVKAAADDDGADDSVTLTHTAAGGDYDTLTADLAVTVVDDDRGLVFSPDPLSVGEGDTTGGSYTVALATQPSAEVTVTVSGHAGSDVTVEGLSASDTLTFTTANWATAQTVTVKAAADDDGADDSVTLTHTAAGGDYDTVTADLAVTVVDDDRGLVFSPDPLSVGEGDTTGGSYTVALATQPSAEVTVTVSGHAGSDVTVEGLSASDTLTFTTANWATAQTVTVKAAADDDGADDSVTLTHTAAGGDYDTVTADLAVTVVDDDRGLVFSPDPLSVGEGDTTGGSYTVALATQPSAEVTVTVSGHAGSDVTVEGLSASDTLTFTTANWATAQTVTVKAAADDDGADDSVTLTHTAAGGDYDTVTADLAVTVVDDDRGLVFSPDPLSVGEGDTTGGSYTVALATQPSAEVTVTVSGHAGSDVTVEGLSASDTLTFTTANWATAQTVTVKAAADDDGADDSVTLTHTAAGGDYDTVTADLAVTVVDDDRGLVFSPDPLSVGEGDTTGGSYTVALATQPSAEVTVTVSGHAGSDVTVEGLSASDTLTFTTANWATAQTVTVKAAADDDGADDSVTLTHTAAGGDYDTVTADLAVTVVDDDRGLVFSPDPLSVGEGDTTGGSYTVALATQPSAEVTVTVSGHAGSDVTVEGLSASDTLTFTTANWATAQTVTVKAAADDDGADDSVTLTHTAAGGDYDTLTADLAVTVVDDDRGLVFSPDPLSVGEGDTTGGSYTVALATQPSAEVTVTVSGHAGSDVTVEGLSASDTLTFTTANWATAQTVTVKAAADDDGADDSVTLTHTAAGGDYDTVTADLAVTVVDDDRGLVFSPDPLSVGEGDTTGGSYTVALATQPSAEVTVTVSGHAGSDVTVEGLSASDTLTFTTANWATAQTVTVKAAADDDGADDSVTLTHTAAGGDYDTVTADLAVTVVDDDRGLVFSPDPLSVGEGDTTGGSYTVALATQPSAEVTVTVSGHAGSDVTVEGLSASDTLTFTTANWATAQTVTVKAAADDDGADDSVTLTHTAAGGDYDTVTADLAVTVVDDDRGLVFSPDPLSVGEGDTTGGSYTVALATQPSAEVTVTVSGHAGSDVTVEGLSASDTLTFTTANWATAQTVTVKAAADDDGADDSVTLTHTAAGGDYDTVTADLAVTVVDDQEIERPIHTFQSDCDDNYVWCATIRLAEDSTDGFVHSTYWNREVDGWDELEKEFTYGGITYGVSIVFFVPDIPRWAHNSSMTFGFRSPNPPSEDHTAQWKLHVGDVELSFEDATRLGDNVYTWHGAEFLAFNRRGMEVALGIEVTAATIHEYTPPIRNTPAMGPLTVSGEVHVGSALTVDVSHISDADGMADADLRYSWWHETHFGSSDFAGADGPTFTVPRAAIWTRIKASVSFTDDAGNREVIYSAWTDRVRRAPLPPLRGDFDEETVPNSHNGSAAFSFQVYFTEEPSLSYVNVRDHVLTVTNGTVISARRTKPASDTRNIRWTITVRPDGNGDVTVVLPPTTDCEDDGAVCADDMMLSNTSSITVPGPN